MCRDVRRRSQAGGDHRRQQHGQRRLDHPCASGAARPVADDDLQRSGDAAPALPPGLLRHRCPAQAAARPRSQPGGDGQRLCRPREGHARCGRSGAQRRDGGAGARSPGARREHAAERAAPAVRACRGLSRPQGQPELPAAADRAVRYREQDRRVPALLQQCGGGIQCHARELPGRGVRPVDGVRPARLLQPRGGRARGRENPAAGEVLRFPLPACAGEG